MPASTTREAILDAADALFEERGVHSTAVEVIAADAGVTKRTLYNHFLSKDDLVAASLTRRRTKAVGDLDRALDSVPGGVVERLVVLLTAPDAIFVQARDSAGSMARTAIELASTPGHPAHGVITCFRADLERLFASYIERDGLGRPADRGASLQQLVFALLADPARPFGPESGEILRRIVRASIEI